METRKRRRRRRSEKVRQRTERDRRVNSFMMIALDGMGIGGLINPSHIINVAHWHQKSGDDTCESVNRMKEGE